MSWLCYWENTYRWKLDDYLINFQIIAYFQTFGVIRSEVNPTLYNVKSTLYNSHVRDQKFVVHKHMTSSKQTKGKNALTPRTPLFKMSRFRVLQKIFFKDPFNPWHYWSKKPIFGPAVVVKSLQDCDPNISIQTKLLSKKLDLKGNSNIRRLCHNHVMRFMILMCFECDVKKK